MTETLLFDADNDYKAFFTYLRNLKLRKAMLVCGKSALNQRVYQYLAENQTHVIFSDFGVNPDYLAVGHGIQQFKLANCDAIIAVGGGSAIDVAKCIKLYAGVEQRRFFEQRIVPNEIPLIAVPTTAGSGSEATSFAVVYCNGEKLSINDLSCVPQAVLLDPAVLNSLPLHTKKTAMLDALCHGIESMWSVNSTEESMRYARQAIKLILDNMMAYLAGENSKNAVMLQAAHLAGKAINISQTTAGHAMCYKLTSLYGLAHGHAAALCLSCLLRYTVSNLDKCIEPRGKNYFISVLQSIAEAMGCADFAAAAVKFTDILHKLNLAEPEHIGEADYTLLANSVNPVRLKNNPLYLSKESINEIYREILENRM